MDVEELIRRAWEATEKAGVPERLQEPAFKEAVASLRAQAAIETLQSLSEPISEATKGMKATLVNVGDYEATPDSRRRAPQPPNGSLIDWEENRTLRAVLVGMLREMGRK